MHIVAMLTDIDVVVFVFLFSSTFLYLKFLGIWAFVLLLDFILEFRFEYLWPLWLLLRSIYDSYRYQGLVSIIVAFVNQMIRHSIKWSSGISSTLSGCFYVASTTPTDAKV